MSQTIKVPTPTAACTPDKQKGATREVLYELAFSGQKATGNVFAASEYAGLVRLNEFRSFR